MFSMSYSIVIVHPNKPSSHSFVGLKMGDTFLNGHTALTYLQTFGSAWNMLPSDKALVFIDNHDNQRGHGGGGNIITYKHPRVSIIPVQRFSSLMHNCN